MKVAFYGDSLTRGAPGVSFFRVLKAKLPEHELVNYGKGGDTVVSLCRRIEREDLLEPVDIAVLWVGVNDVLAKLTFSHSILKRLMHQPRAIDYVEFRKYYERLLKLLNQSAQTILTVSPLLIGEDLLNPWNRELADLCVTIASISSDVSTIHYVDLRNRFAEALAGKPHSDYIAKSLFRIAHDTIALQTPTQVDTTASRRGLHYTLDGVHLNSAGSSIVVNTILQEILKIS